MPAKRTVLITGCSEGGLGDALAQAFHGRGLRVLATARNPAKMAHLAALGIETLPLDVLSADSIRESVTRVADLTGGSLDILINNAGGGYSMPVVDADLDACRRLFDLNVWSVVQVTQAFMPLLLKSGAAAGGGAIIANNTSVAAVMPMPMQGAYNSSKAALAMLTDTMRLELKPFGIRVVDLKTGAVKTKFFDHQEGGKKPSLPQDSIYNVAKAEVEKVMAGAAVEPIMVDANTWARQVANELLKPSPPVQVWKGGTAFLIWFGRRFMPFTFFDSNLTKAGAVDVVAKNLKLTS